ncbi:COMM domain-containing protein 4 [Saguinus oedipus]|uniref:COMM domain-containing protein 4 n=1 Tax=Saguinus oedipus TaxID=9490 RepID=A0ABQ9V2Q5_SAGOE|nr:COMM domain-containing protein 4 [Saguinus oedipus]
MAWSFPSPELRREHSPQRTHFPSSRNGFDTPQRDSRTGRDCQTTGLPAQHLHAWRGREAWQGLGVHMPGMTGRLTAGGALLRGSVGDIFLLLGHKTPPQGQHSDLTPSARAHTAPDLTGNTSSIKRFRFCGDLDCPDWVLAEISMLAKMSSVKLRLLCSQVLKELLGQGIDYEKILKLTADTKFGEYPAESTGPRQPWELGMVPGSGDVKATVAVLSFILSSAAKHSVDGESLSSELQQLGLPKEHAASLCRCYEEKQTPLQKHLRVCSLRSKYEASQANRLAGVGWRVDYTLSSSLLQSVEEPMVHLRLEVAAAPGTPAQPVAMSLSADKFQVLLAELKQAQTLMSSLG